MGHPLLCWDIVVEGMARRKEFAHDIKALERLMLKQQWTNPPLSFDNSIVWENKTIIVTDTDQKILLASSNMYTMNGYLPKEVMGNTPKMFQGEATTAASRKIISIAVKNKLPFESDIINYRKNGSLYNCHIIGYPLFNRQGELVNYIALENVA